MRIYRLTSDGKKWPPALENGFFILGDPKHRERKHVSGNAVRVRSEQEAIDLLRRGLMRIDS